MGLAPFLLGMLFVHASVSSSMSAPGRINPQDDAYFLEEVEKISYEEDPTSPDANPKNYCISCLEISRKAEKMLKDPSVLKRIDFGFSTFCKLVPSGFQEKCADVVDMYKNDAIMFLQDAFLEENFCNNSGICSSNVQENLFSSLRSTKLISAMSPFANMLTKFWKGLPVDAVENFSLNDYISTERENPLVRLQNNGTCVICISILEKIRSELEEPDKQLKIISTLLKACETEVFVNKCKKLIFAYGPIVITNIQKVVSKDLCHMVHICRNPKNQTNPDMMMNSPYQINISPAQSDVF